ncbi:MAG: tetratricopeptide repeat protein [Burkholderiales bacterium]|nr:tetratricopeptide repeat protein [Anaerolineae bacterium]
MDISDLPPGSLTAREVEVLRLVAAGLSNRDIAEELVVAAETVRWYTKQIYSKLGVSGRIQAVNHARALGLLQDDSSTQSPPAPPSTSIQATTQPNLPLSITPFIGRAREIAEVKHLLVVSRLLTLTGVGGTGKTRLALRVASEVVSHFADGVYFVDLAPLSDAMLVAKAIAAVLGVVENSAEPQLNTLKRSLADRELLVVIDNFEHVIDAAPLISELLVAAPRLKILVTSREGLRLSGEQEYPVPPLSLVSAYSRDDLADSEAVSLFVQRAQMLLPQFEITADNAAAIAQICARLDGLPLAIELAAGRSKLLSPQTMLARLDSPLTALTGGSRDAPHRQQTLRRTIDWSYNLLDEGEKILFARLAVFRGGRSLEAIEAVCGQDLSLDVFDGLAALVDKSLIQQKEAPGGEPRFVMLETIHEYARERLAQSGEAETIRRRYAAYFVDLAERAESQLRLAQHARWSQLLELELNNLREVLEGALSDGDLTSGVRLTGALYLFWWAYGYHVEGYHWTQQLLERLEETPITYHPQFLLSAGLLSTLHDLETATHLLLKMLAISRQLGEKPLTGWALTYLGSSMQREPEAAIAAAEEGLAVFRELDHKPGIAQALNNLGLVAARIGDSDRANRAYDESLIICQQTGETRQVCLVFQNIGFLAEHKGDHERAWEAGFEALRLAQKMNNRLLIAMSLPVIAGPLGSTGQPQRAARLLGASEAALESMGAFPQPIDKPEIDRITADVRAQLNDAALQAAWAEGRAMTLEQALANMLEEQI